MDTKSLITEAKARFNHNSAKSYLKDKYDSKFIVADQLGLWRANIETINFLNASTDEYVILIDTFNNPVKVNRIDLLHKLNDTYKTTMEEWYNEWIELEKKR
jgi:hemerythrin superfamily protein